MAVLNWAGPPVSSTQAAASNPSTATLIAELSPDNLAPVVGSTTALLTHPANRPVEVVWTVAASTLATWWLEHCLSTGLGSTAVRDRLVAMTGSNETAQLLARYLIVPGDRLRARIASTFTGDAAVKIRVEGLS